MAMNLITKFSVRRPGEPSWSTHRTEKAAIRECRKVNRLVPGHRVYAVHVNGDVTGPYDDIPQWRLSNEH